MLRVVPAMPVADEASPAVLDFRRRIKNTLRCQRELLPGSPCGIPLMYRTKDGDYILAELVRRATYGQIAGKPCRDVECPNCGTVRTIILR